MSDSGNEQKPIKLSVKRSYPNRWLFCYNAFMNKGTIKPLRDLLLIELDEKSETTASGIYLKEAWEVSQNLATVVDGGDDTTLTKDTRIIINPYAVMDINDEKNLKFIKQSDVLGTM